MKNLKISLTAIIFAIIVTIFTGVYAYTGLDVDTKYEISMPDSLTNGTGTVNAPVSEDMKYQFVEINKEKYDTLKKYEAQLELMQAYIKGEAASWEDSQANAEYEDLVSKYESTYNEKISDLYTQYTSIDSNSIATVRSLWIYELTDYNESNWKNSTDSKITLDLTTFTGTKYYIAWVKIGDTLDAEAYVVTGTKKDDPTPTDPTPDDPTPTDPTPDDPTPTDPTPDDPTPDDPKQEEPKQEEPKQEEPKQEEPKQEEPKQEEPKQESPKKEDPTDASNSGKVLPKTGVNSAILGLITIAGASAGISYRKYRKIK